MTIARDLTERMDFDSGHVRYCLEGMVARLGLSRATISRHVAYLRELGSLVWVEHGSRTNVRRARGLAGYAGTATVYGAVIPAAYDDAHGHTIVGSGYAARIVIDQRGTAPVSPDQVEAVDNSPVDNQSSEDRETPSRTWVKEVGQVEMVEGCNYTSRQRASRSKTRILHQSTPINGRRRTANDVRRAERTIRLVRALVSWTQTVPLRRLEYVLRPFTDRGLDAHEIAAELTAMCSGMRWRPQRPDMFISQRLAVVAAYDQQLARETEEAQQAAAPMSNPEWAAWIKVKQRLEAGAECPRTDAARAAARATWNNWPTVADHYAEDPDDALDLYGHRLCQFAIAQAERLEVRSLV
ncbi:hypothetical protein FE633_13095 [Streptomyces montanus]|uniref:Uncharacterized protein n=1 Tax=Streptomyces montanus TaxID=2580423 RepID=A0A5R9FSS3_9ACTN|nr:hypothetical protein [Streptomyces montanus]TLS45699.1 hypothetical protein FE633_13095 [Streptomyces montanus]